MGQQSLCSPHFLVSKAGGGVQKTSDMKSLYISELNNTNKQKYGI